MRIQAAQGVTVLTGAASRREEKYLVEDIAAAASGVTDLDNSIRAQRY